MARSLGGGSLIGRLLKHGAKMILSVAVLSVFVLGIVYGVKKVSGVSPSSLAGVLSPYLSKVGINENEVGQVAGDFIQRITDFGVDGRGGSEVAESGQISSSSTESGTNEPVATLAIFAESHVGNDKNEYVENKTYLAQALAEAEELGVDEVLHIGDISNFGDVESLTDAKEILGDAGIPYIALPGDHDLAQTSSLANFSSVFGIDNHVFEAGGYKFVAFDNSANYTLISQEKVNWFETQVSDADFVILSQPLYTEGLLLFNCQYMGNSCSTPEDAELRERQVAVHGQRDEILKLIREADVKAVIAGDHHRSSETQDKDKPALMHYVVGAVGGSFKEGYSQEKLQTRRFSLLKLYESGAFSIEDIIL